MGPVLNYSIATNVETPEDLNKFTLYPNPASSKVSFSEEISLVKVFSYNGKLVKSLKTVSEIDVSDLNTGLYLTEIRLKNGEVNREKLLVR
jgi:hypothetical protein